MNTVFPYHLFSFVRDSHPEIEVYGSYAIYENEKLIDGDQNSNLVIRSLLKPWQFIVCQDEGLEGENWAIGLSSHSGRPEHIAVLNELASQYDLREEDLFCPRAYPLDYFESNRMRFEESKPTRFHHPCSGKHLAHIAACKTADYPIESYWHSDHPLQRKLSSLVAREVGEKVSWLTDSCGLPTAVMRIEAFLRMSDQLVKSNDPRFETAKTYWLQHPGLVGGEKRLDTEIMNAFRGRILAKEGADGLLLVQSVGASGDVIMGCLIKLAGGYNVGQLALALWSILDARKDSLPEVFVQLRNYLRTRIEEWVPRDQHIVVGSLKKHAET